MAKKADNPEEKRYFAKEASREADKISEENDKFREANEQRAEKGSKILTAIIAAGSAAVGYLLSPDGRKRIQNLSGKVYRLVKPKK